MFRGRPRASIAEQVGDHPHLACLLDAVLNPQSGQSYLFYRYGCAPLNEMPRANCALDSFRRIATHTLCGLEHLHSLGLYHSDIKPPNVLVEHAGILPSVRVCLADLGVVVEVGRSSSV